ncbi:MAG: hypothetical protein ACPGU1_10655 [Myxococcota bacterium]
MSRGVLAGLALCVCITPAASALPPTTDLLGCPLVTETPDASPREGWKETALKESGVRVSHPADWSARQDGSTLSLEASDGQAWASIRWGRAGQEDQLDRIRRDVELLELGPTHLTPICEARSSQWLLQQGQWQTVRLSVTRRAFGMKRRSFALFASYGGGTITAIVTVKWRTKSEDALTLAVEMLSRLRVDPASVPGAARALDANAPQG